MNAHRKLLLTLLKLADLAVVTVSLVLSAAFTVQGFDLISWRHVLEMQMSLRAFLFVGLYLVYWHFVLRWCGLYNSYRLSPATRELKDLVRATMIAVAPLVPASVLLDIQTFDPEFLLSVACTSFVLLGAERRVLRSIARSVRGLGRNLRDVIIVGDGVETLAAAARLAQRDDLGYQVVKVIAPNDTQTMGGSILSRVERALDSRPIDEVFLALPLDGSQPLIRSIIALCEEQGVTVRVVASLAVLDWARASVDILAGQPVITISTGPRETPSLLVKRALDLVAAGIGIFVLSPLFMAIALAIKLDSKGPVFFSQERVGLNRRRFHAYKFRTMVPDAEQLQADLEPLNEANGPVFKIEHDPRVTRLGRWLRRLSLDELPQLFNVVLGDMSLVGPRPLPVRDVNRIDVRWHNRRFSVKPGITCLWQVTSRTPNFDEWIQADMEYIDNWSLSLDLKILARTFPAVITGQGAH